MLLVLLLVVEVLLEMLLSPGSFRGGFGTFVGEGRISQLAGGVICRLRRCYRCFCLWHPVSVCGGVAVTEWPGGWGGARGGAS
jgi:hypothetical protein